MSSSRKDTPTRKREIVEQHGEWTAHPIDLGDGVFTLDETNPLYSRLIEGHPLHLRRILQVAVDVFRCPLNELRVLDLACLEGLYAVEFALHGAETVGIEGRESNVVKAQFAKEALGLDNLTFHQDDVRNLSVEKYGTFDLTMAFGILYHLDAPDVFRFVEQIAEVTKRAAIIDTHVALRPECSHEYRGQLYHGVNFAEHAPDATAEQRERSKHASLDNVNSFWLTRNSFFNLAMNAGFKSVYSCYAPAWPDQPSDRDTFLCLKGERSVLRTNPAANSLDDARWSEDNRQTQHPSQEEQGLWQRLRRKLRR